MRKYLLLLVTAFLTTAAAFAQVTTSSMTGTVKDAKEALPGATISATHQPTGTVYSIATNEDGRFNISNMRVGGPYQVTISFVGYQPVTLNDVYLRLGEAFSINQVLSQTGVTLTEVKVTGRKDQVMNSRRTGASTNISRTTIENLPTSSRSLNDFLKLTPQAAPTASGGTSFGGANNKFNNITIDGAVNNDVFGLASNGTPGGQAGTQPISLDAIQEIQVVIAPYDVSLGNFTGAGVNAITRSGTNKFEGSAYYFNKSDGLTGKNVLTGAKSANFSDQQYGIRLGGPIIKNKLFFFVNGELGRRTSPLTNNAGDAGAVITSDLAKSIADFTLSKYGYDVGGYGPQPLKRQNNKIFAKLDWNIDAKNQLTARYNYIDAFDDNLTRSASSFGFGNNAYKFANKQHVAIIELRSNISQKFSNNLILGYTRIRDARETAGSLFPSVQINRIGGVSANNVVFGSERSSVANQLDQDVLEFTDNFKINTGIHNITIGTHNEFFKFRNLFINNANGRWTYDNVDDYLNQKAPLSVAATVSRIPGDPTPAAKFNAAQLGFYVQDEIEPVKGLRLTGGLRLDIPVFGDTPLRNPQIEASFPGYTTNRTPSTKPLFSPRFGFNYDVLGDRSIQVRGGTGIFTGRVPFVWLSNQYGSSGMLFSNVAVNSTGTSGVVNPNLAFQPDPSKQGAIDAGSTRAEVDLVTKDFKIPQVFRSNIAVDFKLPAGIIATLEGVYSKTINGVVYSDLNLKQPNLNGQGTPTTLASGLSNGADNRLVYGPRVDNANFTNVILLSNSNKGHTVNLTAQLQKTFNNGFSAMAAYTFTDAKSVNDGASSTALSNWEFVQMVNDPNNPPLATSVYQVRHRIIASAGYKLSYGPNKAFATGISLFYTGYSGQKYTYLYNGDLNGDGRTGNDLLFVPRSLNDIKLVPIAATSTAPAVTVDAQWAALSSFIDNDPYLSKHKGEYTVRNGASAPFQHQFDLRIIQDLGALVNGSSNKLQLSFDIFNVGNLLNKSWGRQYTVANQAVTLVNYSASSGGGFTFRAPTGNVGYATSPFGSAWSAQFGIRYLFN